MPTQLDLIIGDSQKIVIEFIDNDFTAEFIPQLKTIHSAYKFTSRTMFIPGLRWPWDPVKVEGHRQSIINAINELNSMGLNFPIAVEDIQSVVAKLKYKNIGILITDHNVNETLSICDRAYLLIEGKIFKHGTAEQLADDEKVRRLYLGTNFELKRKDWIIDMERDNAMLRDMDATQNIEE